VERFAAARPLDLTAHHIPSGARLVLAIGRLHAQKGHDLLIEAIAPLMAVQSNVHLAIIGEGPERHALKERIEAHRLTPRIHLVGRQTDVAPWLKSAALFVLPSRWEGMPNVVLEALAAGVAMVCTDVEGIREVLPPDRQAAIVPPESPDALRSAMLKILETNHSPGTAQAVPEDMSGQLFTTNRMIARYARLYHELLQETADMII
jgi:glycosyltransferase involved in cell wall biosynthesis